MRKIKNQSKKNYQKSFLKLGFYKKKLEKEYNIKIDYLEFRDEKTLKLNFFKNKYRLFIAYHINGVRLIDNF